MGSELLTLYNVINSYKCSLLTVLDKIDQNILQAIQSHDNTYTKVSITKKYTLSLELVEVVQKYVQMLYLGENIAEELLSKVSILERDIEPEKDRRSSNPFVAESTVEQQQTLISPIKNELGELEEASGIVVHHHNTLEVESAPESLTYPKIKQVCESDSQASVSTEGTSTIVAVSETEKEEIEIIVAAVKDNTVDAANTAQNESRCTEIENDTKTVEPRTSPTEETEPVLKIKNELLPTSDRCRTSFKIKPKKQARSPIPDEKKAIFDVFLSSSSSNGWKEEPPKVVEKKKSNKSVRLIIPPPSKNQSANATRHHEKKTNEKCAIYEIVDDVLCVDDECVFCYIITPTEFYLRSDQSLFEGLENSLNEDLNTHCQYVVNKYKTKEETRNNLGNFCVGFIQAKRKWVRVEVLDWMMEEPDRILVQLLDYGEKNYWTFNILKPMTETHYKIPKMAIKCHLAGIYAPSPEKKWTKESVDFLTKLSEMNRKTKFKPIYVNKEGDSYGVDLVKISSYDEKPIGDKLVQSGHALQVTISNDDYLDKIDEEDLEEYDTINEAIAGYDAKDEARICPFTDVSGMKCFKGPACKLEHGRLSEDGITTDKILATSVPLAVFPLPKVKEYIKIFVTAYINTCQFYAHIINNRAEGSSFNEDFIKLRDAMNANNVVQTFEPFKVSPGISELVLVREDNEWLRGRCLGYAKNNFVEVFLVDFGFTRLKKLSDLRHMKEEFLYTPFQAIECVLNNCQQKSDASQEESFNFFRDCICSNEFHALVINNTLPLNLTVWDKDGNDMAYVIKEYGLGEDRVGDLFPEKNMF